MPTALPSPHLSCSAQTLRRVSSFGAVLRKRIYGNLRTIKQRHTLFPLFFLSILKSLFNFVMLRVCSRQTYFISESVSLILKEKKLAILDERITDAYITCIGMLRRHVLCLLHILYRCGVLFIFVEATPNAFL